MKPVRWYIGKGIQAALGACIFVLINFAKIYHAGDEEPDEE